MPAPRRRRLVLRPTLPSTNDTRSSDFHADARLHSNQGRPPQAPRAGRGTGQRGEPEEDRYCIDVLTQINAARAALDKVALGLLDDHTRHCLLGEGSGPDAPDAQADELMAAVGRMLSR